MIFLFGQQKKTLFPYKLMLLEACNATRKYMNSEKPFCYVLYSEVAFFQLRWFCIFSCSQHLGVKLPDSCSEAVGCYFQRASWVFVWSLLQFVLGQRLSDSCVLRILFAGDTAAGWWQDSAGRDVFSSISCENWAKRCFSFNFGGLGVSRERGWKLRSQWMTGAELGEQIVYRLWNIFIRASAHKQATVHHLTPG